MIHGGTNGEMPSISPEDETIYVYDLTLQEARDHFEQTKNYKDHLNSDVIISDIQIPTLDDVFALF